MRRDRAPGEDAIAAETNLPSAGLGCPIPASSHCDRRPGTGSARSGSETDLVVDIIEDTEPGSLAAE